jgi:hypothetical protein
MFFHHKCKKTACYFVSQEEVMKLTQEVGDVPVKEAVPIGPQNGPCGDVSCYTFLC